MSSFSFGLLAATNKAKATSPLSLIFNSPDFFKECWFFERNQMNKKAPIRLFPSENG